MRRLLLLIVALQASCAGAPADAQAIVAYRAVHHPVYSETGNIGGGGFMLVYDAASDTTTAIDYREMAPLAATRDMFLYYAHQKFGQLLWHRPR